MGAIVYYHTESVKDRNEVLQLLLDAGFLWHSDRKYKKSEKVEHDWPRSEWVQIGVRLGSKEIFGSNSNNTLNKDAFLKKLGIETVPNISFVVRAE